MGFLGNMEILAITLVGVLVAMVVSMRCMNRYVDRITGLNQQAEGERDE